MIAQNKNFAQLEVRMKTNYFDLPIMAQDFLSYMDTIKGKSANTICEYHYDLRSFFRFLKLHYKLVPNDVDFNSIVVTLSCNTSFLNMFLSIHSRACLLV